MNPRQLVIYCSFILKIVYPLRTIMNGNTNIHFIRVHIATTHSTGYGDQSAWYMQHGHLFVLEMLVEEKFANTLANSLQVSDVSFQLVDCINLLMQEMGFDEILELQSKKNSWIKHVLRMQIIAEPLDLYQLYHEASAGFCRRSLLAPTQPALLWGYCSWSCSTVEEPRKWKDIVRHWQELLE